jgi:hypothetical protein
VGRSQDALTALLLPDWLRDDVPGGEGTSWACQGAQTAVPGGEGTSRSSSSKRRGGRGGGKASWALRAARGAVRVLRVLCTLGLVLACAEVFFWPPMEACGIDQRGLQVMGWVTSSGFRPIASCIVNELHRMTQQAVGDAGEGWIGSQPSFQCVHVRSMSSRC